MDEQIDREGLFDVVPAPWPLSRWRIVAFAFGETGAASAPQAPDPLWLIVRRERLAVSACFLASHRKSNILRAQGCWAISSK